MMTNILNRNQPQYLNQYVGIFLVVLAGLVFFLSVSHLDRSPLISVAEASGGGAGPGGSESDGSGGGADGTSPGPGSCGNSIEGGGDPGIEGDTSLFASCQISISDADVIQGDTVDWDLTFTAGSNSYDVIIDILGCNPVTGVCGILDTVGGYFLADETQSFSGSFNTAGFNLGDNIISARYRGTYSVGSGEGQQDVTVDATCSEVTLTVHESTNLTSVNLSVPSTMTVGVASTISAAVENNGTGQTLTNFDDIFLVSNSTTGPWTPIGPSISKSPLASGNTSVDNDSFTPSTSGTYYISHCVDVNNDIPETDESVSDNCSLSSAITVSNPATPEPNLISIPGSLVSSGTLQMGSMAAFSAQVDNVGTADATMFSDDFRYCWGAGCSGFSNTIGSQLSQSAMTPAEAARTDNTSASLTLNQSGILRVRHCVDVNDQVSEGLQEGDNCTIRDFMVATALQPNLTSSALLVPALTQGVSANLSANVSNNGSSSTGIGFDDVFEYSYTGGTGPWTQIGLANNAALSNSAPARTDNISFNPPSSGNIWIQHCVDYGGDIVESDESVADQCEVVGPINVVAGVVNGICGPAAKNYTASEAFPQGAVCTAGTANPVGGTNPPQGGSGDWVCEGISGGSNSGICTATRDNPVPVNGSCGTADGYTYGFSDPYLGGFTLCSAGNPSGDANPPAGGSDDWICTGVNGGSDSPTCTTFRNASPGGGNQCSDEGIDASPRIIREGDSTDLELVRSTDGATCTVTGGNITPYAVSSSGCTPDTLSVSPTNITTYTITCDFDPDSNPGPWTDDITIQVVPIFDEN